MSAENRIKELEAELLRERVARRVVDAALRDLMVQRNEAVKVLASMTKHAPHSSVTVTAFAVAHIEACKLLERMQKDGVEAAK